jgi:hypothetical protein
MGTRIGSPASLVPASTGSRGAGAGGRLGLAGAVRDHHRLASGVLVLTALSTSSARVGVARRGAPSPPMDRFTGVPGGSDGPADAAKPAGIRGWTGG